jgi:hypothetical protein
MKITKKDLIYLLIIACLLIGWTSAVITQQTAIARVKGLYNHLVEQCNTVIGAKQITNFCITLPNGQEQCNQNDLNLLQPFLG